MASIKRIKNELRQLANDDEDVPYPVKVYMDGDNLTNLRGEITGPPDSPYVGGTFMVSITVPNNYPFSPPKIKFETKIWHPNITTAVCVDVFHSKWLPTMSLRSSLMSIQQLMAVPDALHGMALQSSRQYNRNLPVFNKTAMFYTNVYANGPNRVVPFENMVNLVKVYFDNLHEARNALAIYDWNLSNCLKAIRLARNSPHYRYSSRCGELVVRKPTKPGRN